MDYYSGVLSILLHAIYSTQKFKSLTYRNMPFVLSPYAWGKISHSHQILTESSERAHQDGLLVDVDSPESFEEVFWLTFVNNYLDENKLCAHDVDDDVTQKFKMYIRNILISDATSDGLRYLSKNNNNLLRLPAIRRAFPNASIIIPFRYPAEQAYSLLRLHQIFNSPEMERDNFSQQYFKWLGHFEFGLDHRPFCFDATMPFQSGFEPDSINYWLEYWTYVYQEIQSIVPDNVVLLSFERLCTEPESVFAALSEELAIDDGSLKKFAKNINPPESRMQDTGINKALLLKAVEIHSALEFQSI